MNEKTNEQKAQRRPPPNLLGPILLVGVGLILLGNTLGLLSWSIWWSLLRLWPVFLIAAGLELLIGRRSIWGSLLATVLIVAVLVGAVWLSLSGTQLSGGTGATEIRQPLGEATQAAVQIDPSVGSLQIEALLEPGNLVEGAVQLSKDEGVVEEFSETGGRATYRLATTTRSWVPFSTGWGANRVWNLGLSSGATLEVVTNMGAGQSVLDLGGLTLEELRANTGVGLTEVYLPADGSFEAIVEGGVGVTTVHIPEELGARVRIDSGLVVRDLPADFRRQGENLYQSPNYESAEDRVDLELHLGVGIVQIRQGD